MRTRRRRTFYAEEFRKKVLDVYYGSEESIAQISERFDVNVETVRSWVFRSNSERDKMSKLDETNNLTMKKEKTSSEDLEKRIQALEKALEDERMRSICLDKMIDIAEQELKIDIRKKSGAKQSTK